MNIIIVSLDEPIYLFQFWEKIFERINRQIVKVYIYKPRKIKRLKWLYETIYNLLLVLSFYNLKNISRVLKYFSLSCIKREDFPLSLVHLCKKYNLAFAYIDSVNSEEFRKEIKQLSPDIILAQVPVLIKKESLVIPRIGWINKHFGLMPDQKGVAPVLWSYWNGENKFGITIHIMNDKFDEGEILRQAAIDSKPKDTVPDILTKLNMAAIELVLDYIEHPDQKQSLKIDKDRYFNRPTLRKLLTRLIFSDRQHRP